MAFKTVDIEGIGQIRLRKYRKSRSLRISIDANGLISVSLPTWLPYASAIAFAKQKQDWIASHLKRNATSPLLHGQQIGKTYRLEFIPKNGQSTIAARVGRATITVHHPVTTDPLSKDAQLHARNAVLRALRKEAESILPDRLHEMAGVLGYEYSSVSIKRLKSRWGSCSSSNHIILNMFLVQLPWELIDYVILHELNHTVHPHHQRDFWTGMTQHMPDAKIRRKRLKEYRPAII